MSTVIKDLGAVSAYAYAVEKGYTGTEAEFAELMADYAEVGQRAEDAAESALNSKTAAQTAATTATNKASEATTAAQTATTKAGEASQSASDANTAKEEAVTAKTAAETAQGKAEDAQAAAERVAESIPSDYSQLSEDVTELKEGLTQISAQIRVIAARDDSWRAIKENVKMGFGELLYPVGTEFEVECPSDAPYNSIIFVVVDHRVENNEHIMTMLMKHVIYSTEFDAIQAIICPEETMPAGTYHFTLLDGYDTTHDGGKNVQFTLANDLEAGGQIVMSWPYNQTWIGENLTVYHAFGTTVIETCVMSEGTGGTDLGVADGTVSLLNHTHRARYGSNNYKESAIRNWLNSDDAANTWQTQQTRFQRPCSYRTRAGFVTYLDPEFVAVIREGTHLNRTNEIFDLNGKKQTYSTTDKFYLASQEEIGFSSESGIVCGSVFDYYNGALQADKIKYDINSQATARYWWLRTPNPSNAYHERYVISSGALSNGYTNYGGGAVAACEI